MQNTYEIQNLSTKEWTNVNASCPKKAVEKLTHKTAIRTTAGGHNAEYYVSIAGGQSDKYKRHVGRFAPVTLWITM